MSSRAVGARPTTSAASRAARSPVPVVLAGTYGASLAVMLVFVAARGDGPPPSEYVLAGLGAGLVGIVGLSAFYRGAGDRHDEHRRADRGHGRLAAGDRRPDRRRRARPAPARSASRSRSSGSCSPRARTTSRPIGPREQRLQHRARDRRRPGLRHVLRARRVRLATRDVAWTLLLSRVIGLSDRRAHRAARRCAAAGAAPAGARRSPRSAGIGLLDLGANALFNHASTMGELSSVAVASSLYPVVTVMLAALLLGERVQGVQRVGRVRRADRRRADRGGRVIGADALNRTPRQARRSEGNRSRRRRCFAVPS